MALVLAAVGVAAAQTGYDEAMRQAMQGSARVPKVVELTDKDMTGFIQSVTELKKLGLETRVSPGATDAQNLAHGLATNREALAVLTRNGFTLERFEQVTASIAYAFGALETKGKEAEIDKARAEQEKALAQMKDKLTPEQYAMMRTQMQASSGVLDQLKDQPPKNLELAAKYRQQIEAAAEVR
jgi:hypothetical protein